jgi:hypothetical protein
MNTITTEITMANTGLLMNLLNIIRIRDKGLEIKAEAKKLGHKQAGEGC